jgi:hypothetical protein
MLTMHTGDPVLFEERPGFALRERGAEILARTSAAFVAGPVLAAPERLAAETRIDADVSARPAGPATTESPDALATEAPTAKNTTLPEPAMSLDY